MKIEILYPEAANLYGDLMNAEYLARSCGAEIVRTALGEEPCFIRESVSLVYLACTTEKGQNLVRDALKPYSEQLKKQIEENNLPVLVTGNAMEIFGESIKNEDGTEEKMLGWFPTYAKRNMMNRYNSLYWGKLDDMDIVGFKSQFGHSYGDNGAGFLETVRGAGLNPETKAEGFRINNFMATYLLGPIVILNPPFAKYLLKLMGVEEPTLAFEEAAMDVYEKRLGEFKNPNTGFIY